MPVHVTTIQGLAGTFAHGYRATNWLARNNMGLAGTLFSTEMLTWESPEAFPSIRDVPIDALAAWEGVPPMAMLPRAQNLMAAKNVRIAREYGRPLAEIGLTEAQAERVLRLADFEMELERQRRIVQPDAPSRFSCVFVAEDTAAGRAYAQMMATADGFVMIVRVPLAIRWARADAHWLGTTLDPLTEDASRGYWSGQPCPGNEPLWEWLVDGIIECADPEQLELLHAYNRHAGDVIPGAAGWTPPTE